MTAERARDLLRRYWLVVAVCVVFGLVGALVGTRLEPPMYESTVVLRAAVSPATPNAYALLVNDRLIGTDAALATSRPILDAVSARYPALSPDVLSTRITVKTTQNTQLFSITVQDPSPTRAADIANALAAALVANEEQVGQQLRAQAEGEVAARLADTAARITTIAGEVAAPAVTPQHAAELNAQLDLLKTQYRDLSSTLGAIQERVNVTDVILAVAVPPRPDFQPSSPKLLVNLAGGLAVGFLVGLLVVVALGYRAERARRPDQVADALGMPILGVLAAHPAAPGGVGDPRAAAAYRPLVQALDFLHLECPARSVVVTSVDAEEAGGAVAAGLALALAARGERVVLADANWRHPSQAARFGLAEEPGLGAAVLAAARSAGDHLPVERFFQAPPPQVAHAAAQAMRVVAAGPRPANPAGVVRSPAMGTVFRRLVSSEADRIIFDAPGVLAGGVVMGGEAAMLSANADLAIVVVDLAAARLDRLDRARASLRAAGARVVGCFVVGAAAPRSVGRPDVPPGPAIPTGPAIPAQAARSPGSGPREATPEEPGGLTSRAVARAEAH